jgi:hypothetical protein
MSSSSKSTSAVDEASEHGYCGDIVAETPQHRRSRLFRSTLRSQVSRIVGIAAPRGAADGIGVVAVTGLREVIG